LLWVKIKRAGSKKNRWEKRVGKKRGVQGQVKRRGQKTQGDGSFAHAWNEGRKGPNVEKGIRPGQMSNKRIQGGKRGADDERQR